MFNKIIYFVLLLFVFFNTKADETPVFRTFELFKSGVNRPYGFGPVCSDRKSWSSPILSERSSEVIRKAESLLNQNFPPWNEDLYVEYRFNGFRYNGEKMMNARKEWLYPLIIAECVEGNGRFLSSIERTITELIEQPTWTWPAHDINFRNLMYQSFSIDLVAADTAHELSQAIYMLGDWLKPDLRAKTLKALNDRVFEPFRKSILKNNKDNYWIYATNNWNAVCLKGVVAAALTVLTQPTERALFAAAGESLIKNYISGFGEDGYTSEGSGYWNYGFSHFAILRELLMQHSDGKVDLFADPKVLNMAKYGYLIEMLPDNIAAFGDASSKSKIDEFARAYANDVFKLSQFDHLNKTKINVYQSGNDAPLAKAAIQLFVSPSPVREVFANKTLAIGLHTFFESAGVLVSRPSQGNKLAVSIKAGGNTEHSHNDIGSYTIGISGEQPTGDVGSTIYSAKTSSIARYSIAGISSWGHPVPLVAGKQQLQANTIRPRVISTNFSDNFDEITINMADAYSVPSLLALTRTMLHDRAKSGSVSITDKFEFNDAESFEVAVTTLGNWKQNPDGSIDLWQRNEHLTARFESSSPIIFKAEKSNEEGLGFTRIGVSFNHPQRSGFIKVRFEPAH